MAAVTGLDLLGARRPARALAVSAATARRRGYVDWQYVVSVPRGAAGDAFSFTTTGKFMVEKVVVSSGLQVGTFYVGQVPVPGVSPAGGGAFSVRWPSVPAGLTVSFRAWGGGDVAFFGKQEVKADLVGAGDQTYDPALIEKVQVALTGLPQASVDRVIAAAAFDGDGVYGSNLRAALRKFNKTYRGEPGDDDKITAGALAALKLAPRSAGAPAAFKGKDPYAPPEPAGDGAGDDRSPAWKVVLGVVAGGLGLAALLALTLSSRRPSRSAGDPVMQARAYGRLRRASRGALPAYGRSP